MNTAPDAHDSGPGARMAREPSRDQQPALPGAARTTTCYPGTCGTCPRIRFRHDPGDRPCTEYLAREASRRAFYDSPAGRRLLAEAIPQRPPSLLEPITPEQARQNYERLDAELTAHEGLHQHP